jgi:hypothetical protein
MLMKLMEVVRVMIRYVDYSWCTSINGLFAQSLRYAQRIILGI